MDQNTVISNINCRNTDFVGDTWNPFDYFPISEEGINTNSQTIEDNELTAPGQVVISWLENNEQGRMVRGPRRVMKDKCVFERGDTSQTGTQTGNILLEAFCDTEDQGRPKYATYYCTKYPEQPGESQVFPDSLTNSRNGICTTNEEGVGYCREIPEGICFDSDGTQLETETREDRVGRPSVTDESRSFRKRGFTVLDTESKFDKCTGQNKLIEYYCGTDEILDITINCLNGCSKGRCLNEGER